MPAPDVSVVIPTYNRRELLPRVLRPVLADARAKQVVVVVDGSRDGSLERLQELARDHPKLRPVFGENRGKEGARQAGLELADREVVLFLDDDVVPEPGLVSGHAEAHAVEQHVVVLGYMPVALPPRRAGNGPTLLYATEYEGRCQDYEANPEAVLERLWGGNVSLRRLDAQRVGFISTRFSQGYHQDRDFGLRCLDAGLHARFRRDLRATHLHRRSLPSFRRDARHQGAARRQLHEVHAGRTSALPRDEFAEALPRPLRSWVLFCRRPRAARVSGAVLHRLAQLGAGLRFGSLELVALRLLRRIEQQRGAVAGP
jgi:glycosyltransferase involved in cell wall biosynthesis